MTDYSAHSSASGLGNGSRTVSSSDALQHRPLPAPPSARSRMDRDQQTPRMSGSASMGALASLGSSSTLRSADRQSTLVSSASNNGRYGVTPSSSGYLSSYATPRTPMRRGTDKEDTMSPTTPGDPRMLDRAGLIGVGELATPRYLNGSSTQGSVGRSGMQDRARGGMPSSGSFDSAVMLGKMETASGKRERQVSGPRMRGGVKRDESGERQKDGVRGVPRLPSFGDLGGTFKVPTPTSAGGSSPSSPGHPLRHQPNHAMPSTPSAHSILRQFGSTRDFSHLPPSPSTASINKIMMKESGSMGSLAFIASGEHTTKSSRERKTLAATESPRKSRGASDAERERKPSSTSLLDEGTQEVIRRLDGLGKTSTGSLKARSLSRDAEQRKGSAGSGCELTSKKVIVC